VTLAAAVLTLMALVGLGYAIATISIAPGTVDRFRSAAAGAADTDIDGYVSVVWIGAAVGAVLAVILFALYVVLALGLRRGSNAVRITTWVVCGLGLLAGCGSMATVLVERSGDGDPQSLGAALSGAYPDSWIGLNLGLAIAQMVGYVLVALLLLAARGAWFGRGPAAQPGSAAPHPGYAGYGAQGQSVQGYGVPGYGPPGSGYGYGAPYGSGQPQGYPPAANQGLQPGAGPQWGPGTAPQGQQPGGPGQPPASAAPQQSGQPFSMPPATPSGQPPKGPDDEFWSRPSS
jgi:hypothetical protein